MKLTIPALCLLLTTLLLTACGPIDPALTFLAGEETGDDSQPLLETRFSGTNANVATQSLRTIRTQGEWTALWTELQQPAPGPLPRGKMAVVVMLGQRISGGYKVEIVDASREQKLGDVDKVVVNWREYKPAEGSIQTQAITSPWAMLLMTSWPYAPEFREQSAITLGTNSWAPSH